MLPPSQIENLIRKRHNEVLSTINLLSTKRRPTLKFELLNYSLIEELETEITEYTL